MDKYNRIEISDNIYFVYSYGEYCFKEVLEDFKNANYIKIVTFNIIDNDDNYKMLFDLFMDTTSDVEIITNIPNTYDNYKYPRAEARAEKSIRKYREKLYEYIPIGTKYSLYNIPSVDINFNLHNHSKIIMTNNVAYIGSANFTFASKKSFETGILIYDSDIIEKLKKDIIPILRDNGDNYWGENQEEVEKIDDLLSFSYGLRETIDNSIDLINYKFSILNEFGYRHSLYFEEYSPKFTLDSFIKDFENLSSAALDLANFVEDYKDNISLVIFNEVDLEIALDEFLKICELYKNTLLEDKRISLDLQNQLYRKILSLNKCVNKMIQNALKYIEDKRQI
jgi:hypothetical protein